MAMNPQWGGPAIPLGFHKDGQSFQSGLAPLGGMAVSNNLLPQFFLQDFLRMRVTIS